VPVDRLADLKAHPDGGVFDVSQAAVLNELLSPPPRALFPLVVDERRALATRSRAAYPYFKQALDLWRYHARR
jgi:hypothetical protein